MRLSRVLLRGLPVLIAGVVLVVGAAAPGLGQTAPETGASDDLVLEIPLLDPDLLASAASAGERAAVAIRARIGELAQARIDVAVSKDLAAQAQLASAASALQTQLVNIQEQGAELDQIQFSHRQIVEEYESARRTLGRHVAFLYTINPSVIIANDFLKTGDLTEATSRHTFIRAVLADDRRLLLETYVAAAASSPDINERAVAVRQQVDAVDGLTTSAEVAAAVQVIEFDDLSEIASMPSDWLFPVDGDYNFTDTFLAPRMTGSRYAHRHQGADIFADEGAPLVAVERGLVGRVGEVSLGGLRVWLLGESGTNYYYAHLSAFADDLEPGQFVEAGTVLGYVGHTGNAISTPPHVHFQVHPGGGSAVNPFPLLDQVAEAG